MKDRDRRQNELGRWEQTFGEIGEKLIGLEKGREWQIGKERLEKLRCTDILRQEN